MTATDQQRMTLEFDEPTHTYRWGGVIVPSVTRVLEDVGIIDYSYIPDGTREMALDRGRRVHKAAAFDAEGELDETTVDEMDLPYVLAARQWRQDSGVRVNRIEHRACHELYRYAGTRDLDGWLPGRTKDQRVLADYKCGQALRWTELQTAAYAGFDEDPRIYLRLGIELHADGTYKVAGEWPGSTWQKHFNGFLSCLNVYRLKREYGGRN